MKTGLLVVHAGEPAKATRTAVAPWVEARAALLGSLNRRMNAETIAKGARKAAETDTADWVARLKKIGGSPADAQGKKQSRLVESDLRRRGHRVLVYRATQCTQPTIPDTLSAMRKDGVERVITLPVFPVCDPLGVMRVLDAVEQGLRDLEWSPTRREVTGWHRHPDFCRLHADAIGTYAHREDFDLHADDTEVLFVARGEPVRWFKDGPKYPAYVQEVCRGIARELGRKRWGLAYTTDAAIRGKWMEPGLEDGVDALSGARALIVPVTAATEGLFTLSELDLDVAGRLTGRGISYHRAPLPWATGRFAAILADLVEDLLRPEPIMGELNLRRCLCRGTTSSFCLNSAS